ncbi:MAG TPA: DEAD/DEAH box helicase, partial [Candidatus Thermoplasmatota archaeon]|nr:DEAD/DEAH box helicase [Candidatus Thermoplasmatota archaeon]
ETIAAAQLLPGRVLVVCPASAREVWRQEVARFTVERCAVLGPGADPALVAGPEKYVVVGYSNLEALGDAIRPEAFDLVVLDESHYVKNASSGRARLVRERLSRVPRRLVVSGTPVMNAPDEMRAQLAFLHPEEWSDAAWFRRRFEEPFEHGTPEVREAVLRRLRQFLDGVMLRREKREALPDLPPKAILWHRVQLPPEARRAYAELEADFEAYVRAEGEASLSSAKAAGRMERLKQSALAGKLPQALAFVRGLLDAGDKVVLFSRYRDALASVARDLEAYAPAVLTGDSSPEERAEAQRRFQEDPACRVFVGQLVAAGTALTLVAGTHAVFLDLDWNPANHRQAMDRIHRRGQTRPVAAHFFLAEGTIDDDVAHVLDEKGRMMDALLAGGARDGGSLKEAKRLVGARLLSRRQAIPTP